MAEKKIIAVLGATGSQGGGLVRAILEDPDHEFAVRALTRNPDSEKAKALTELGAEVVAADVDDTESLVRAFEGAYGAFCVSFFWEDMSAAHELRSAESMAEAAKRAGVHHVIWSTLDDTRKLLPLEDDRMPVLQEKYNVPHFDAKEVANQFFIDRGVPTTFLYAVFYWDNMINFGSGPTRGEDGKLIFVLPMGDKRLPAIAAEDIGRCALGIFKRGDEFIGKTVGIAGGKLTGAEMAAAMSKAFGEEVTHVSPSFDDYRAYGFPGADEMGNMFQFKHDFEEQYCASRSIELARELNPKLMSFEQWLEKYADRIPIG
jgi:uncharacterized protein YbjT (DUF2867 family)